MLKIQTTKNFSGMGYGNKFNLGEYFQSQNMGRTLTGIAPRWSAYCSQSSSDSALTTLDIMNWFAQKTRADGSTTDVFSIDKNGIIWKSAFGAYSWGIQYDTVLNNDGNGLIGDQKNRLLFAGRRYLGMYDGGDDYITGTVSVTNGNAAVVGTGTSWGVDMVNKRITFGSQSGTWYRVTSVTDGTHLTLTAVYSGASNASTSHRIYVGWHEGDVTTTNGAITWSAKDFGTDIAANTYTMMEQYEADILILRNNYVCRLNSGGSFNGESTAPFSMPQNFVGRAISSNKNGILMGFNLANRGVLVLWDNYSTRSIAPWIWFNDANILAILPYGSNWIVITSRQIILTNGYTTQALGDPLDNYFNSADFSIGPQGATIIGDKLVIANSIGKKNRHQCGFEIFNLVTHLWEHATAQKQIYTLTMGAIFSDSALITHISFRSTVPDRKYIGQLNPGAGTPAFLVTEPLGDGNNDKTAEGIKIEMGLDEAGVPMASTMGFTIEVSVCNMRRSIFAYAENKVLATSKDEITIDGTVYSYVQAGDEITVANGANAGETRKILSMTGAGTSTCVLKLDSALPEFTEQDVSIFVGSFQLIKRKIVSNLAELKDMYFDVQNKVRGKKFLVKALIKDITGTSITPEIRSVSLIYDDLGII